MPKRSFPYHAPTVTEKRGKTLRGPGVARRGAHSGGVDDVGQTGATVPTLVDDTHPAKALCTAADPCTLVHYSLFSI